MSPEPMLKFVLKMDPNRYSKFIFFQLTAQSGRFRHLGDQPRQQLGREQRWATNWSRRSPNEEIQMEDFVSGVERRSYQSDSPLDNRRCHSKLCPWRTAASDSGNIFEDSRVSIFRYGLVLARSSNGQQDGSFQGSQNHRTVDSSRAQVDRDAYHRQRSCQVWILFKWSKIFVAHCSRYHLLMDNTSLCLFLLKLSNEHTIRHITIKYCSRCLSNSKEMC